MGGHIEHPKCKGGDGGETDIDAGDREHVARNLIADVIQHLAQLHRTVLFDEFVDHCAADLVARGDEEEQSCQKQNDLCCQRRSENGHLCDRIGLIDIDRQLAAGLACDCPDLFLHARNRGDEPLPVRKFGLQAVPYDRQPIHPFRKGDGKTDDGNADDDEKQENAHQAGDPCGQPEGFQTSGYRSEHQADDDRQREGGKDGLAIFSTNMRVMIAMKMIDTWAMRRRTTSVRVSLVAGAPVFCMGAMI